MHQANRIYRIAVGILVLCAAMTTQSCRVMSDYDINRSNYENDDPRPYYMPEKEAVVGRHSYAYRWQSGDLEGLCQQFKDRQYTFDWADDVPDDAVSNRVDLAARTLFDSDSSVLTAEGFARLDDFMVELKGYEQLHAVIIHGHTDNLASEDYNLALGKQRAEAVHDYLSPSLPDVPVETLSAGESQPVASNADREGRQANRRVEIEVVATPALAVNSRLVNCYYSRQDYIPSQEKRPANVRSKLSQRELEELEDVPLSQGDAVRLTIPNGAEFSGVFEVGMGGRLSVPLAGAVRAHAQPISQVREAVRTLLLDRQLFRPHMLSVELDIQKWSSASVYVRGAVFNPGRVTLNRKGAADNVETDLEIGGDFSRERLLSYALFAAGGVRPDADLQNIVLKRKGKEFRLDVSGIVLGHDAIDVTLVEGDEVIVPTTQYFQPELVRPTQITPPGIRIFMSNLTTPASSNSQSSINGESSNVPYGTRMLRALVSANCVGGVQHTNGARRAVLISTNPASGKTEVVERSILQLISDPDRDEINPYLMPNDGVACFDSGVTNFRDVVNVINEFLQPVSEVKNLLD